ncbi:MAG: ferritin-like domain-containing protein [Candidatus Hodarchaeales archaeon]
MDKEKRIEFFKKQMALEKSIVEKAEAAVSEVKNALVKQLILGIAMDSNKHESLLKALVALNVGGTPFIPEEITDKLKSNLEEHIKLEKSAIQTYQELLDNLEEERERVVIKAILEDEKRHHKLLVRLHKMIIEQETLTEQDLWDWTWKDSLFHGTPGG